MTHFKHNNGFIAKSLSYLILIILVTMLALFYWVSDVVEQEQETITSWISEKLGYPIDIAEIKLSWVGTSPQLELKTVKVMGQDNSTQLLSLKTLYLNLNILSSAWFTDLRLDDITVVGLNIAVTRDPNGLLALQGFNQGSDSTPLFADMIVRANSLKNFRLKTITVDYVDQQQTVLSGRYQIDNAVVKQRFSDWHTDGLIILPASLGDKIQFSANWALNKEQPALTPWQWSVDATDVRLAPLNSYLHWQNIAVEQGRIDVEFSGRGVGEQLNSATLDLDLSHGLLATKHQDQALAPVVIEQFAGKFAWRQQQASWRLSGTQVSLDINDKKWPETTLTVSQQNKHITAKSDFLRIEDLIDVATLSGTLPEQLTQQRPAGDIEQVEVLYQTGQGIELASFTLKNGQVKPWRDYPGFNNLNAEFVFSEQAAKIKLASQQVTVHPATWLDDTVFFDVISGELEFEKNEQDWRLQGHGIQVKNDDLEIQFDGDIQQHSDGKIINDVVLTLDNIAVARWQSYFPEKLLSESFKNWSAGAFLAGEVVHGQIKLQGDMAAFPYQSEQNKLLGNFDLALQVKDVQLHYAKAWPDLFDVTGTITGQGNNLIIKSQQGSIAGFAFQQVETNIDKLVEAEPILTVDGRLKGTSQQALNFLQNSPLKQRFGSVVKAVSAKGKSDINLNMTVPLADTDGTQVKGDVSFIGSHLYKKSNPKFGLMQVNGLIKFHNKGVTANNIKGQFLDQSVDINVFPKDETTVVSTTGMASTAILRQTWPEQIPDFITGKAPYQLDVVISERSIGDFYIDGSIASNMKGLAIALPAPLQKTTNQTKRFKAAFKQATHTPNMTITYDDTVDMVITPLANRDLFDNPELEMTVTMLDVEQWLLWSEQYQNEGPSPLTKLSRLSFDFGQLSGYGQQFSDVLITAQKQAKNWQALIKSPAIRGSVSIPQASNQQGLLHIDLEKLALSMPQKDKVKAKAKRTDIWPSMAINVKDLVIDNLRLGHFKLTSHQDNNKWLIDSATLTSDVYSGAVSKGVWQQSAAGDTTELVVRIDSHNFAGLLKQLDYQPVIQAEKSKLEMAFSWPSDPLAISQQTAKGTLSFKLEKGKLNDVEPGAAGRVFGLLSVAAIPRRLALDFNELFGKGLNFRTIKGSFDIANGIATTQDLVLQGESVKIEVTGPVDLENQLYNQKVKVTPNVSSTLPIAGAVAGGPIGLGVGAAILLADKLAGKLFDKEIVNIISYNYNLTGPWQEPDLSVVRPTLPKL